MNKNKFIQKNLNFASKIIERLDLKLNGLNVLTECASGAYAYTAVIALMSGAKVKAFGKDTRFGTYEDNKANTIKILSALDPSLKKNIEFVSSKNEIDVSNIDICTNSGMLRPIDAQLIQKFRSTTVLPLMWGTWEFRDNDLDIKSCQKNNIAVIGTNEYYKPTDFTIIEALLGLKILFDMNIAVGSCRVVLIGGKIPANQIAELYEKMGIDFVWFSPTGKERKHNCYPYSELKKIKELKYIDAFVCAEHTDPFLIAGKKGGITFEEIHQTHPFASWGHIVGNVNIEELKASGLTYYPETILGFGYQTYGTENLGYEPVIQLNTCGLKVGELAAKARLTGKTVEETIKQTIDHGIGQDFEGGFLQFKPGEK
jgi:hypothetical protein